MRKLASLLLALVLVFGLATTAFAASGTNDNSGKITIGNAVENQTYTIYQLLVLESYDTEGETYAYKAASKWEAWLKNQTTYVSIDEKTGYVTWVSGANAADFAEAAKAYAKEQNIEGEASKKAESATVVFENLNLGYYLVDSTLGTLCSLDTTNPTVTIQEKNAAPTNEKTVEEDSTGAYGKVNDADIGQTVNFKSTITAQAGAENYVFHDKMSSGLTFGSVTGITLNGTTTVATTNYTVKTTDLTDDCTFEVVFTQAFCDTLKANDQIVISYTATLNASAVVGLSGNPNESKLSYGDSSNTSTNTTPPSKTITYTWDVDVLKYANGKESEVLKGVKFVLLNSDKTKVAKVVGGKVAGWETVPTAGTDGKITWPEDTTLTTNDNGKIEIDGLDADTYYLREIEALPGFNILSGDQEVKIDGATRAEDSDDLTYTTKLVKINNQSGTELPSTGGMGTTIFYILGSILVLAAGVLLVTKKRMSAEN